tara:strand:- start:71 stop:208 length:138 start_codon:yes stop_codon:yes gene_type:complete
MAAAVQVLMVETHTVILQTVLRILVAELAEFVCTEETTVGAVGLE